MKLILFEKSWECELRFVDHLEDKSTSIAFIRLTSITRFSSLKINLAKVFLARLMARAVPITTL